NVQGTNVQGTNVQGTNVQGQRYHGNAMPDTGTRSSRLTGIKIDPETSQAMLVAIRGFHGDAIDALVWKPRLGHHAFILSPSELIGLQWIEPRCTDDGHCSSIRHRIVDGLPDTSRSTMPVHADNRDVWLFEVQYTSVDEPAEEDWQNLCQPDHRGEARGLFLDGQWRADGSWDPRGHTFACTSGVLAKCARNWGYKPWKQVTTSSGRRIALQPLHQACTRAARADYCGDGISHTRNGTLIDLFDRYGLNVREQVKGFNAEAGFTTAGAAWVTRPRWPRGDEDRGDQVQLGTCARPKHIAPASESDVLIQVWSRAPTPPARD
ncbi:MAG TPA: ADYC domain-containing protein, partial [Haliangium sp.]|nr:ADYC domain-containing protein [Haliangium sp.]